MDHSLNTTRQSDSGMNNSCEDQEDQTTLREGTFLSRSSSCSESLSHHEPTTQPNLHHSPTLCNRNQALSTSLQKEDHIYQIKILENKTSRQIFFLLQNENGPCPLLAVVNLLLLRGIHSLLPSKCLNDRMISNSELLHCLSSHVCDESARAIQTHPNASLTIENMTEEVLSLLPSLSKGLNINCRFDHPKAFEFTPELSLFDLLNVTLVHSWVADSQDPPLLQNISYNQAVDYAARHSEALTLISEIINLIKLILEKNRETQPVHSASYHSYLGPFENKAISVETNFSTNPAPSHSCSGPSFPGDLEPQSDMFTKVPILPKCRSVPTEQPRHNSSMNSDEVTKAFYASTSDPCEHGNINCDADVMIENEKDDLNITKQIELVNILRSEFLKLSIDSHVADEIIESVWEYISSISSPAAYDSATHGEIEELSKRISEKVSQFWETIKIVFDRRQNNKKQFKTETEQQETLCNDNKRPVECKTDGTESCSLRKLPEFLLTGYQIRDFLERSANQITYRGFQLLHDCIPEGKLAVLFRNDHFTVIYKLDTALYQLVSDIGFLDVPTIMWERLDDINGNTTFFDADFNLSSAAESHTSTSRTSYGSTDMRKDGDNRNRRLSRPTTTNQQLGNSDRIISSQSAFPAPKRKLGKKSSKCNVM